MNTPLVVIPGRDDSGFASARRVNFGAALPELLERLGFGRWDSCTLAELGEEALERRPLVVVAYAPEPLWTRSAVEALRAYAGPLVIEGPMPEIAALDLFGLVPDGEIDDYQGRFELVPAPSMPPPLAGTSLADGPAELSSLWTRAEIRSGTLAREELAGDPAGSIALAYLDDAVARLDTPNRLFSQPRVVLSFATLLAQAAALLGDSDPAVAAYAPWGSQTSKRLLRLIGAALEAEEPVDPAVTAELISARGEQVDAGEVELAPLQRLVPELLEFLLHAAECGTLHRPGDSEAYRTLAAGLQAFVVPPSIDDPEEVAWAALEPDDGVRQLRGRRVMRLPIRRLAALCTWAELAGAALEIVPLAGEGEAAEKVEAEAQRVRDMARVARRSPASTEVVVSALDVLLDRLGDRDNPHIPLALGWAAEAAAIVGHEPALRRIIGTAEDSRDRESGLLKSPSATAPHADPSLGVSFLAVALRRLGGAPGCGDELIERWRRGLGPLQRWITIDESESAAALLRVVDEDADTDGLPLAVGEGFRIGLAFPLLSWLVAECAPPPSAPGTSYVVAPAGDAWDVAIALLEAVSTRAGLPRRVAWPWPAAVGATVVHKVGTLPPKPELERALAWEARGRRASTYCLSPADPQTRLGVLVEQLGHEIALNGESGRPDSEAEALRSSVSTPVVGGLGKERFRGPGEWLQAEAAGLSYTILPWRHSGTHPRAAGVVDGRRGAARLLELECFDAGDATNVRAALRKRDHLALPPDAAAAVVHELRDRAWWSPLGVVFERTRRANRVQATVRDDVLELASAEDLPALQVLLGELPEHVPCLLHEGSVVGRLAAGPGAGTFALDLKAGVPVQIVWRRESDARDDDLPVLEPSPLEPRHRDASLLEIKMLLDEVETGRSGEMRLDNVASS